MDTMYTKETSEVTEHLNISESELLNITANKPYCEYFSYDETYDYYNIADRAKRNLIKPHHIIALSLATIAMIANIFSLLALFKVVRSWSSHFKLLLSIMISDLFVDFSVFLHVINKITNPLTEIGAGGENMRLRSRCVYMVIKALNTMGLNITLLNLMGMALDHYLAIIKPLHHKTLLNTKRCTLMIVSFWIIATITGFSDFLSPLTKLTKFWQTDLNYCEYAWLTWYQEEYTLFATALLCLCLMTFMYTRIYYVVKKRAVALNLAKEQHSRRTLLTTLLIVGTFIICWLPSCLFQISLILIAHIDHHLLQVVYQCLLFVDNYLYDLMLLNTLLDPIIYAIRIKEIKTGYRLIFRCCFLHAVSRSMSASSHWDSERCCMLPPRAATLMYKQEIGASDIPGISDNSLMIQLEDMAATPKMEQV